MLRSDILLIARIFPRPCGARKNTTQLTKYPRVLYAKPSNKMYILTLKYRLMLIASCEYGGPKGSITNQFTKTQNNFPKQKSISQISL